ncbi:carboxylesterase/lipase family protein [Microbacterium sp. SLBN-146]|uniref:carboxylesterase/lipase family protein n=1 Tax=Microbacterium sp. SLBN-146 TaxID=2768457 RepID=UPI001151A270|nr:carboxylesterase/lipase family protein [Microbacterium sp. SLBN-146]TQJ30193.1 para-nitrobenzyl esterase [Microbacterium sp. SLBN-146]
MTNDPTTGPSAVRVYRGIRFAEPPVGDLRWQAPVPLAGEPDPRNAFGPAAPQHLNPLIDLGAGATQSEDCLTLNVWSPESATSQHPLPVMVWVHGGAYAFGGARSPSYDGTLLAQDDVVVVTINYRLGALGWLDLPELGPSNLGLRDVLCALGWVREHIGDYGGDPSNVTVFGESAGGGIVTSLLTSPAAAGLFDAAIAESSPATTVSSRAMGAEVAERLLEALGATASDLRTVGTDRLVAAAAQVFVSVPTAHPGHLAWAPTIGDDLLSADPATILAAGKGLAVPLLLGTNRDEAHAFAHSKSPLLPVGPEGLAALFAEVRDAHPEDAIPDLPHGRRADLEEATQASFRMPAVWIAEGHGETAPTHLYRFDHATPMLRVIGLGAAHATEVPYVFGTFGVHPHDPTLKLGGHAEAIRISARVRARWTGFARNRSPEAPGAPEWPAYRRTTRSSLVIDVHDRVADDLDGPTRTAWGDTVLDVVT